MSIMTRALLISGGYAREVKQGRQIMILPGYIRFDVGDNILISCPEQEWCMPIVVTSSRDCCSNAVATVELDDHGCVSIEQLEEFMRDINPDFESGDRVTIVRFRERYK